MARQLIVIYGPPLAGKTTLAREVARSLDGKAAIVSLDQLLDEAIVNPDPDAIAELDMARIQLRLLVANYLKNRYHVVIEGSFLYERDGALHSFENDIDQLIALMRPLTERALMVRLQASDAALSQRADLARRQNEVRGALRISAAYKDRFGLTHLTLDSEAGSTRDLVDGIQQALTAGVA